VITQKTDNFELEEEGGQRLSCKFAEFFAFLFFNPRRRKE